MKLMENDGLDKYGGFEQLQEDTDGQITDTATGWRSHLRVFWPQTGR